MQSSVFTYLAKNYYLNTSTSVKVLLFVKLDDDNVIVMASRPGKGMGIDVVMSYDQLMKHKYLKAYYELSLKAIGKPNLDPEYGVLDAKEADAIDAIYIVEDILTKEKVAIKGESYHTVSNYSNAKDDAQEEDDCDDDCEDEDDVGTTVATDVELAEFNAAYDAKFDETNFDERIAAYKALVDKL
jgi:tRNA splicing endonuclease